MKRVIENVVFGVITGVAIVGAVYLVCFFVEFMFNIMGVL